MRHPRRRTLAAAGILTAFAFTATPAAHAAPGSLVPSFGTGGVATVPSGLDNAIDVPIGLGTNHQLYLGSAQFGSGTQLRLGKFNATSGANDASFGGPEGYAEIIAGNNRSAKRVAVAAGGRVYVAGESADSPFAPTSENKTGLFVAQRTSDGGAGTFGAGGITAERFRVTRNGEVQATSLGDMATVTGAGGTDRGVVLVGRDFLGDLIALRVNESGGLDTTWGEAQQPGSSTRDGQLVLTPPTDRRFVPKGVDIDAQGRTVIAGNYETVDGSDNVTSTQIFALRLTADGQPDETFGPGGLRAFDLGTYRQVVSDVVVTPAGILLSVDTVVSGSVDAIGLMRLTSAGAIDTSFANGGLSLLSRTDDEGLSTTSLVRGSRGEFLLTGSRLLFAGSTYAQSWLVARFRADGSVDTGFGDAGAVFFSAGGTSGGEADGAVVDGDRLVVSGSDFGSGSRLIALDNAESTAVPTATPTPSPAPAPTGAPTPTPITGGDHATPTPTSTPTDPSAPTPAPAPAPVPVPAPRDAFTVNGVELVAARSTERSVRIPNLRGKSVYETVGAARSLVPYSDVQLAFSKDACGNVPEGTVTGQTPGENSVVAISANNPAKIVLEVCLSDKKYEKTCSAAPLNKILGLKKGADFEYATDLLKEIDRCKTEYEVKFSPKATEVAVTKVSNTKPNTPAEKKTLASTGRKPITAAIQCPTSLAEQDLYLAIGSGFVQGNSTWGLHAPDPKDPSVGWTIPAGFRSSVGVTVFNRTGGAVNATLYVDTSDVNGNPISPSQTAGGGGLPVGKRLLDITPQNSGIIRLCAVQRGAGGEEASTVVGATSIRVSAKPRNGTLWPTITGRTLKLSNSGTVSTVPAGTKAQLLATRAGFWDGLQDLWNRLWGTNSQTARQVASTAGAPEKKAEVASTSGYSLAQVSPGATLGSLPALGQPLQGAIGAIRGGKVYAGTGPVIKANAQGGTTVGIGPSGVIAPGGANVIAPGGANVIAPGGANVIAPGGANVIAPGGGNVIAPGGGNVIAPGGGNVIAPGGANVIAPGGANIVFAGGAGVIAPGGANVVAAGGLN